MSPTILSNKTARLHTRTPNKWDLARYTHKLAGLGLIFAVLPTLRWYALRLQDGGGELAGLVPLSAAIYFAIRNRNFLVKSNAGIWTGAVLLLFLAAVSPIAPAIIRALLVVAAGASAFGVWRRPSIVCLLTLSLPWTASLEFFLGYPLRLLTAVNAQFLLGITGTNVTRAGVQLLYEGRIVGVDPACSGMNILWSTALLTSLLAALFSLKWKSIIPLSLCALTLTLAGNSIRASLLFFPEAGILSMPHLLHPGIGVAIAGFCFLLLVKLARGLSGREHKLPDSARTPTRNLSPVAPIVLRVAGLLVLIAAGFSKGVPPKSSPAPPALTSFRGVPVRQIALTEAEENFYRNFPGSIAIYESTDLKLIVRHVSQATRKLHPASHCLQAEGFRIGEKSLSTDDGFLTYRITRDGETLSVKEQVTSLTTERTWPEISAWYWHALFHPNQGPWTAVTMIEADRS